MRWQNKSLVNSKLVELFSLGFVSISPHEHFFLVRRNNGSAPSHWRAGSGTVARKGLQTLESLKLVEKDPNGGRRLTSQGRRDLDRIAAQISGITRK